MVDFEAQSQFVYDKLRANASLIALLAAAPTGYDYNIHPDPAPPEALLPVVTFLHIPGTPDSRYGTDGTLAMSSALFLVRATVKVDSGDAVALSIMEQIDTALGAVSGTIGSFSMNSIRRSAYSRSAFVEAGVEYKQVGAYFDVLARPQV